MPETDKGKGVRVGQVLDLTVERAVYRGQGLARHEGQVVFLPRALPGDRVRARVDAVTPGYVRAHVEELLAGAASRRESPCPYFTSCGGCAYQHQDYAAQVALKEAVLRDALRRAGAPWDGEIVVHPSPERGWRMRATMHFEDAAQGLRLGFHQEGTRRVVDVEVCLQLSDAMNAAARELRRAVAERPWLRRRVRDLELAESMDGRRLVASLEGDLEPEMAARTADLARAAPGLSGFGIVAGQGRRRRFLLVHGDPRVDATVMRILLRAHVRSFFQANRFLVEPLAQAVADLVPPGGSVIDLYAGVGLFALPLARRAEEVRGLEISASAVEDAEQNARANGVGNVRIHQGDVSEVERWPKCYDERVVLDPPRTGAGATVVRAIAARRPGTVVYVSCDPPTLGRDLKLFASLGYVPRSIQAFDLFPDTFHLETVVELGPA